MKRIQITLSESNYSYLIGLLERDRDDQMERFKELGVNPLVIKGSYELRTNLIDAIKSHSETFPF